MELRQRIRTRWHVRRVARSRTADPYAQALATASHLGMLRDDLVGESTPARWYR